MTSRTLTPARPRFGRLAVCLAATVALLAMASCSGDDDRADGSAVAESPTDAASSSGDDVAEGGLDIELVGWSPPPYPDDAESVAVGFGGSDYVAVHIRVCLGADADLAPHLVGLVTVGDTDGEPFNAGHFQGAPVASPSGFEAPAPGECSEGWVYPAFDAGLEPATAVWIDAEGTQGGNRSWPLGEPYPAGPLPLFGDVRAVGEAWDVADGASWTVHGVSIAGADDPLAPPRELDPGTAWVVIDAVYCAGSSPGTIHERLGVVIDGWAGRGTPRTVEAAIEPADGDGCEHRPVAVAMPIGMSVTAVTGTDHTGPWWQIEPPVDITG